jgi:hypothetical protein
MEEAVAKTLGGGGQGPDDQHHYYECKSSGCEFHCKTSFVLTARLWQPIGSGGESYARTIPYVNGCHSEMGNQISV